MRYVVTTPWGTFKRTLLRSRALELSPRDALRADAIARRLWPGLVPVPPLSRRVLTWWRTQRTPGCDVCGQHCGEPHELAF